MYYADFYAWGYANYCFFRFMLSLECQCLPEMGGGVPLSSNPPHLFLNRFNSLLHTEDTCYEAVVTKDAQKYQRDFNPMLQIYYVFLYKQVRTLSDPVLVKVYSL